MRTKVDTRFTANAAYAFKKGFSFLKQKDVQNAKAELMKVFNITSAPAWKRRLEGMVVPSVAQAKKVEGVFKKYGVPKSSVWGL